jgi:molybdopterin converting factor small subunit
MGAARLAVNHALATPDTTIGPDDEVALIALLGGG